MWNLFLIEVHLLSVDKVIIKCETKYYLPNKYKRWTKFANIQEEPAYEYEELLTTPAGTLRYQRASLESKKVLFVAVCRTLGVPARLNPLDGEMQYYGENAFLNVENSEKTEEVCEKTAQIHLESGDDTRWVYMQNWTIAKKSETGYLWQTLQLGEGYQGEAKLEVEAGTYRVITTTVQNHS